MSIPTGITTRKQFEQLVARADRGWKETDKLLVEKLRQQVAQAPLFVYLTRASRNVIEDYTGMLPPYTLWRKVFIVYLN